MNIPILSTERLRLLPPSAQAEDLYDRFYTHETASIAYGGPLTPGGAWTRLATDLGCWHLQGFGVWLLQRRADSAIGANRFDAAIADFTTLLQTNPNDARLLLGLGMAQVGKGNTREAIALFDRMLAVRPFAPAFYGRAVAHLTAGDRGAALADLDRALALDPKNAQYARVRAQVARWGSPPGFARWRSALAYPRPGAVPAVGPSPSAAPARTGHSGFIMRCRTRKVR